MQYSFAFLLLLGSGAALTSGLTVGQGDAARPVSKVITLLQDMIKQLQHEAEEDNETYETMGCWCTTNDKEKTRSISNAEQHINELGAAIESLTGNSARLNAEIENLDKELGANEEALDSATALRKKQMAEFNNEEKEMLSTIRTLKGAVTTLSKHHGGSALLQQSATARDEAVMQAAVVVQTQLRRHADFLSETISPRQRKIAASFAQNPDAYVGGDLVLLQEDQPQSGEIFGILQAMTESFEQNLEKAQREETANDAAYEDLKAAKKSEIAAGQSQIEIKTGELASTDEKNAQSKQDLEDTQQALEADTAFLSNLKDTCASIDSEYEERTKTRQLEIQAVSKALEYLSGDASADLFGRTTSLVQTNMESSRRSHVVKVLSAAFKKSGDPRISTLAMATRIAAFGKVKGTITEMIDKLTIEKEDEIKHKDFCIIEIQVNERSTASKYRDQDDLEVKIDDLKMQVDELAKELEVLKAEIAELRKQLKNAGIDREKENHAFQSVVADQRATQKLLTGALNVLKGFYEKNALVQKGAKQAPPPGFKNYEKNKSSGGVMGAIQNCISDSQKLEAEAIRGEEDAQKGYENFTMDSNDVIAAKNKEIMNKQGLKAKAEVEKVETQNERDAVVGEIKALRQNNHDLHSSCDYVMKNFDLKQQTRDDEIESLKESISIFSGASFGALLQNVNYVH